MKRIIILLAIFCAAISAKAQFPGGGGGAPSTVGKISGTLIDSVSKKPLDYASVSLFKSGGSAPITGVLTDEKGNFKLNGVKTGKYKITISYVGYPTKTIDGVETTPSKPDKNLGNILVKPSSRTLNEVTVTGQVGNGLVENRIDKIVYNAEKDLTAAGGSATDVLQKVPLVSVDLNGNVSLRGDANVRVLINGKPSGATAASLSDVLKGIPADQIKTIEVITSPSAKYDAEGSAGIINIITKQKNISGISGSISGGVGTRQNNGNLNLNYNKNRFNLTINAGGNASWPQTSQSYFNQQTGDVTTTTTGSSRLTRHAALGSITAGYEFNSYNSITTTFKGTDIMFNTKGSSATVIDSAGIAKPGYTTQSTTHAVPASGFDWNLDYTHKFHKEGEELDLSTQWSHNSGITDFSNIYSAIQPDTKDNIDGVNNEYTLQADYTLPISKVLKLEAGGKSIFRRINTTSDLYNYQDGQFVFDDINSSLYKYNQNVYAGYSVFTISLKKGYSILAGIRDENTDIHGVPTGFAGDAVTPFSQNYNTVVPSLTFQKALSATQTIKLAYSKRITRPSLQYLNPFPNKSNNLSWSEGNPELSPEISQTVEVDYNTYIKSSMINFSVYYKRTSNLIESLILPNDLVEGGTIATYQNIGVNNSIGGSFFGSITPFKILTIMGNINAYTYTPKPYGDVAAEGSTTTTYVQLGGFLRATLTLPDNWLAEGFGFGRSSSHTIQGTTSSFSIYGVGVRRQFMQKKMSIGLNAIQPFSNYKDFNTNLKSANFSQTSQFQLPFRSFGLTFSYNFGKLSFSNPQQKKKGVNNDDMKQDQGGVAGGAGAGN